MGHPAIENQTPFAVELLFLMNENGQPVLAPVAKATYEIREGGVVPASGAQLPVNYEGEFATSNPESSYRYEPESAFFKPATDVVLIGHAIAPHAYTTELTVRLAVGPLNKSVRVFGDRIWCSSFAAIYMSNPLPFETMPLIYERSFGGWDRSDADPSRHSCDPRNPVGTGFRSQRGKPEDGLRIPNLEDPRHLIHKWRDAPPPACFGFTSPNWQPRAAFAGTYDDAWMTERMPLLPTDFDRRFFNAASPGLVAPGYLRGDESVLVENASAGGLLQFELPDVAPPICEVELAGHNERELKTHLDTVIINTDDNLLVLTWRAHLPLKNGPHDIVSVKVRSA